MQIVRGAQDELAQIRRDIYLSRVSSEHAARAQAQGNAKDIANNTIGFLNAYPWQDAGVSADLALGGVSPHSREAADIAMISAAKSLNRIANGQSSAATDFGVPSAPSHGLGAAITKLGGEASFASAYLSTLENVYNDPTLAGIFPTPSQPRGVLTGVSAEDFFSDPARYLGGQDVLMNLVDAEKVKQGVDRFGQRPGDVADALAKINPKDRANLPSDATDDDLRSAALVGPDPFNLRPKDNPLVHAVSSVGHVLNGALTGTARDAGATLMAPWQVVQNFASNSYAEGQKIGQAIQRKDYSGISANLIDAATGNYGKAFGATDLGVILSDSKNTNRDFQGSGFFLGEAGVAERQRREQQFSAYGTDGVFAGDRLTLGRQLATITHADKWGGDTGANIMSGLVDASVAIKGPQEAIVGKGLEGLGTVRTFKGVRAVPLLGRMNPMEAGILESAWRKSVNVPKAEEFIKSWRGRAVVESLSKATTTEEVIRAFGGTDNIPVHLAQTIADFNAASIARDAGVALDVAEGVSQNVISHLLEDAIKTKKIGKVPELSPLTGFLGNLRGANPALNKVRTIERFRSVMPETSHVLDPNNLDEMWVYARDSLINARIPEAQRAGILSDLVAARTTSERLTVMTQGVMGTIDAAVYKQLRLRQLHSPATAARFLGAAVTGGSLDDVVRAAERAARKDSREMTRMFEATFDSLSRYNVDNLGNNINPFAPIVNGVATDAVVPHSLEEMLHTGIPVVSLSDTRRIRAATSREAPIGFLLGPLLSSAAADPRWYISALGGITAAWKPLAIIKGAYVFKVVGDEQARMAAIGSDALYNNPAGWVAWAVGRGGRSQSILDETLNGTDEFLGVLVGPDRGIGQAITDFFKGKGNTANISGVHTLVAKGNADYTKAWGNNLAQLSRGRIFSNVARDGVTATVDKIMNDPALLRQFKSLGETQGRALGVVVDLGDRGQLTKLVQSIEERINLATGGSPVLREAISTGELTLANGSTVAVSDLGNPHTLDSVTDEFVAELEGMTSFGPDITKALKKVGSAEHQSEVAQKFKNLLEMLGAMTIERPTSRLSRIPLFRQRYWTAIDKNVELLSADAASTLLGTMPEGLPRDLERSIKYKLGKVARSGDTEGFAAHEFDKWAKIKAMNDTNELLVSMAQKNQWEDMLRIISPFAQAWGEVIRTWGRLLKTNPRVISRVNQTFTVLHDPNFADVVGRVPGLDVVSGQSLMYKDDFGQEVIQFPWAGSVSDLSASAWNTTIGNLTGARVQGRPDGLPGTIPFSSSANALSIGASIVPGLGPYSGMLLSGALDRLPQDFTALKETLFPFGDPPEVTPLGVAQSTLPSWLRYLVSAKGKGAGAFGSREELDSYNGKLIGAKTWLLANGSYDLQNGGIAERNRLDAKAQEIVSWMAWTAVTSSQVGFGPTHAGFFLTDANGEIQVDPANGTTYLTSSVASQIYRLLVDEGTAKGLSFGDAHDVAATRLIQEYGGGDPQFLATIIGKSKSRLPGGAPVSRDTFLWLNQDPSREADAPTTWQFFAPQGDDFYYPMYLKTIDMGDRTRFTSKEFSVMIDDTVASLLYEQATKDFRLNGEIIPPLEGQAAAIRSELMDSFPGWRNTPNTDITSLRNVVHELDVVTAPGGKFADHPLSPAIREIIDLRNLFNDGLHEAGFSFADMAIARSAKTEPLRQYYDAELKRIQTENPAMTDVIVSVFRAEIGAGLAQDERNLNG